MADRSFSTPSPVKLTPEQISSGLFKTQVSSDLVSYPPTERTKDLEDMLMLDMKAYKQKPVIKDPEKLLPEERFSKQRQLDTQYLNDSYTKFAITARRGEEYINSLRRSINYITHPLSSSDKREERVDGMRLRSQALQAVQAGLSEGDLNSLIDDFIGIKNDEGLSEVLRFLKSKKPRDLAQGKVINEAAQKITGYFKSTSNLEALETELSYTKKLYEMALSKMSEIESKLRLPNMNLHIGG